MTRHLSAAFLKETFLRNWYLLLLLGIVAVAVAAALLRGHEPQAAAPPFPEAPGVSRNAPATAGARDSGSARRLTPAEQALVTIQEHQARVEADPKDDKAPAYLFAAGNLYLERVQDYERAGEMDERVLEQYPHWDGMRKVYMQLAVAYEKLTNHDKAKSVYQEMMRSFPEDSVEHQYAKDRLSQM
jgi:tetratricopeptide (TPR) repeat protein